MSDFDPARERPAVLFANEAFYRAFADRDFKAMSELWAHDLPSVCIHPGWPALTGRTRILASWERILGGQAPAIVCQSLSGRLPSASTATSVAPAPWATTSAIRRVWP